MPRTTGRVCTFQEGKRRERGTTPGGEVGEQMECPRAHEMAKGPKKVGEQTGLGCPRAWGPVWGAVMEGGPHHWLQLRRGCAFQRSGQRFVRRVRRLGQSWARH